MWFLNEMFKLQLLLKDMCLCYNTHLDIMLIITEDHYAHILLL